MKVVFCTPTRKRPHPAYVASLEASLPCIEAAGIQHSYVYRTGNPYISYVMADMIFTGMQLEDVTDFIMLDDDLSWEPTALLSLLQTPGDVVAGTYRFKQDDPEEYMGAWNCGKDSRPVLRSDGVISATMVPSGFLRLTREAIRKFMRGYPNLIFGKPERPGVDLFNHGVILPNDGRWWGQDYAFSRRWTDLGEKIWIVPDLDIHHHLWDEDKVFKGNLHKWLLRQPGGSMANVTSFRSVA